MGAIFELIADRALQTEDPADYPDCQACGAIAPVYVCQGSVVPKPGESAAARDVYVACADCIRAGRVEQDVQHQIEAGARRHAARPDEAFALLQRTPPLPHFIQEFDWPYCCGGPAELTGDPTPEEAAELDRSGRYWQRGPRSPSTPASDVVSRERLAVFGGVSAFRCRDCGTAWWTFQFS